MNTIDFKLVEFIEYTDVNLRKEYSVVFETRNGDRYEIISPNIHWGSNNVYQEAYPIAIKTTLGYLYVTDCFRCEISYTSFKRAEYLVQFGDITFIKYLGRTESTT